MGSGGNNEHIQNLVLRWGIILKWSYKTIIRCETSELEESSIYRLARSDPTSSSQSVSEKEIISQLIPTLADKGNELKWQLTENKEKTLTAHLYS
jgi:hypothetical protein